MVPLDLLLAANFSISIGMMLLTMCTKAPGFSVFPSLLLVMTLSGWRNVSATRLILLAGDPGRIIQYR